MYSCKCMYMCSTHKDGCNNQSLVGKMVADLFPVFFDIFGNIHPRVRMPCSDLKKQKYMYTRTFMPNRIKFSYLSKVSWCDKIEQGNR